MDKKRWLGDKKTIYVHDYNEISPPGQEYVFLSAGKFMPGMEKLAGELFFPTNQQLFLTTEGSKNSWF